MKIQTKQQLKTLDGTKDLGIKVGDALAEFILNMNGMNSTLKAKRNALAVKSVTEETVELDAGDVDMLKKALENDVKTFSEIQLTTGRVANWNLIISAQLIKILEETK